MKTQIMNPESAHAAAFLKKYLAVAVALGMLVAAALVWYCERFTLHASMDTIMGPPSVEVWAGEPELPKP